MKWIYIVWICVIVQDPCPERNPNSMNSCGVFHSHIECNEHESFLDRDSALILLNEQQYLFFRNPELDSMTIGEYIKKF